MSVLWSVINKESVHKEKPNPNNKAYAQGERENLTESKSLHTEEQQAQVAISDALPVMSRGLSQLLQPLHPVIWKTYKINKVTP